MNSIERNNPKPLYVQLEELIRNNIDTGIWKPQNAIPSESELSKEYDLSRMTIRTACQNLVQEGVLYRVPGKGTFVSEPKIMTESLAYMGFREQLERMGYETNYARASRSMTLSMSSYVLSLRKNTSFYLRVYRKRWNRSRRLKKNPSFSVWKRAIRC